jgi:hypothetical protein
MESFLLLKGIEVKDFTEIYLEKDSDEVRAEAKRLVEFCSIPSALPIKKWNLSSSWYSVNAKQEQLKRIGLSIRNIADKEGKETILFTIPKDSTTKDIGSKPNKRYALNKYVGSEVTYLYCGARATNIYSDKSVVIHAYNRYINTVVKAYLQDYGEIMNCVPSDDQFALSELIQWTWRSRIRNGQPIKAYILSSRMEQLLKDWLDNKIP